MSVFEIKFSFGINDNSGTSDRDYVFYEKTTCLSVRTGTNWQSINTDDSTKRLFGSGSHANPLNHARAPKIRMTRSESWAKLRKTRPCAKNALLRRGLWQTASLSRTLHPKGLQRVQRLGAKINVQRNSNNKVTKNIITQVTCVTNSSICHLIQTIPSNFIQISETNKDI